MKTLPSKSTLLVLVALVLGLGLLVAPAQAGIVWVDIADYTIYNTELQPPDYDLPLGYNLDLNHDGTPEFNMNLFSASYSGIAIEGPFSWTNLDGVTYTVSGQAAGMADPKTDATNQVVGHTFNYEVPDWILEYIVSPNLPEGVDPITNPIPVPVIDRLAEGILIGPTSNYIEPFSLSIGDESVTINQGGFGASANASASIF